MTKEEVDERLERLEELLENGSRLVVRLEDAVRHLAPVGAAIEENAPVFIRAARVAEEAAHDIRHAVTRLQS